MKKLLIILTVTLLGMSCNNLEEGTVISKYYERTRTTKVLIPETSGYTTFIVPYVIYDGADWTVNVKGLDKNGKEVITKYYTTREIWWNISKGDHILINKNFSKSDTSYKKVKE